MVIFFILSVKEVSAIVINEFDIVTIRCESVSNRHRRRFGSDASGGGSSPLPAQLTDGQQNAATNASVAETVQERVDRRVAVRQRDADVVEPDRQQRVDVSHALHEEAAKQRAVPDDDRQPADEEVADDDDEHPHRAPVLLRAGGGRRRPRLGAVAIHSLCATGHGRRQPADVVVHGERVRRVTPWVRAASARVEVDLNVDDQHHRAERDEVSRVQEGDVAGADDRVEATVAERRRQERRLVRRCVQQRHVNRRRRRADVVRRRFCCVYDVPAQQRHYADQHGVSPTAEDDGARVAFG